MGLLSALPFFSPKLLNLEGTSKDAVDVMYDIDDEKLGDGRFGVVKRGTPKKARTQHLYWTITANTNLSL